MIARLSCITIGYNGSFVIRLKDFSMKKLIFIMIGLTGLSTGCTSVTPEQRRLADEQTCRNFGFKPGNEGMANCLMRLELDRRAERRAWDSQLALENQPRIIIPPVYVQRPVPAL